MFNQMKASIGRWLIEPEMADQAADNGGYYVPANATLSQILDYASGTGDIGITGLFAGGIYGSGGRNSAVQFAAVYRAVSLLSGVCAQLLTRSSLRVVDRDGKSVENPRTERIIDLLTRLPDGITPAYNWYEDVAADYLLDGNALVVIVRDRDGMPIKLNRMSSWDADTTVGRDTNQMMYRLTSTDGPRVHAWFPAEDVLHIRWGRLHRSGTRYGGGRQGFALPVVSALRPAIDIGLKADQYVRDYFASGHIQNGGVKGRLAIGFEQNLTPKQIEEMTSYVNRFGNSRAPLLMGNKPTFTMIKETPQDAEVELLRKHQVRDVARVFGIPGPLMGEEASNFGAGIETLSKMFYRFSARMHAERMLAPLGARLLEPGESFDIDETNLLRGDSAAIATLIGGLDGVATQEEKRHIAGLPREGGPPPPAPPPAPGAGFTDQGGDATVPKDSEEDNS